MKRANLELTVGFFVLIGLVCLAYLAINLGKIEIYGEGYQIYANFDNASGLKTGATVEVAGVEVGRVVSIELTPLYQARIGLKLRTGLKIHDDAIASVRTKGIIGDKFIKLSVGRLGKAHPSGWHHHQHRIRHRSGRTARHLHSRQGMRRDYYRVRERRNTFRLVHGKLAAFDLSVSGSILNEN